MGWDKDTVAPMSHHLLGDPEGARRERPQPDVLLQKPRVALIKRIQV